MKRTNKILVGAVVLGLVATSTFAYRGDPNIQGPNYSPERHTAMTAAFEAGDYNAWSSLVANNSGRVAQVINEDNFAKFAEARQAALAGDTAGAQSIRAELGLGLRNGTGLANGGQRFGGQGLNRWANN